MLEYTILCIFTLVSIWIIVTIIRKGFKPPYPVLYGTSLFVLGIIGQCTVVAREGVEEEPLDEDLVFTHISWTPQQELLYQMSEVAIYAAGVLVLLAIVTWVVQKLRK